MLISKVNECVRDEWNFVGYDARYRVPRRYEKILQHRDNAGSAFVLVQPLGGAVGNRENPDRA